MRIRHLVLVAVALLGTFAAVRIERGQGSACLAMVPAKAGARRLVYVKSEHRLCLLERDEVAGEWSASHGREAGAKRFEGDGRTPEGHYTVSPARVSQRFGTFMAISYPSPADVRAARAAGKSAGGGVGIHGPQRWYAFLGKVQALVDHSDGCIVLDEASMRELASRVSQPIPIHIFAELPERRATSSKPAQGS